MHQNKEKSPRCINTKNCTWAALWNQNVRPSGWNPVSFGAFIWFDILFASKDGAGNQIKLDNLNMGSSSRGIIGDTKQKHIFGFFLIQKRLSIIGICTLLDMQLNVHCNWHVHWSANMLHPALISPFWWISLLFASLRIHLDPSCLFCWVAGWQTFEPLPKNLVFFGWFICAFVCVLPQYSSKGSPSEVCMGTSSWAGP